MGKVVITNTKSGKVEHTQGRAAMPAAAVVAALQTVETEKMVMMAW